MVKCKRLTIWSTVTYHWLAVPRRCGMEERGPMRSDRHRAGRRRIVVLGLMLGLNMPITSTQADDLVGAKAAYEDGTRSFNLAEYSQALQSYKESYRLRPDPALLFNIGQCHRLLGHTDEAVSLYKSYLREAPNAKNRADVEKRIDELQGQRPTITEAQGEPKSAALDLTPSKRPEGATTDRADEPGQVTTAAFYKRWWFWTAVGAVAAGAGVTLGVLARRDPTQIPPATLGAQKVLP